MPSDRDLFEARVQELAERSNGLELLKQFVVRALERLTPFFSLLEEIPYFNEEYLRETIVPTIQNFQYENGRIDEIRSFISKITNFNPRILSSDGGRSIDAHTYVKNDFIDKAFYLAKLLSGAVKDGVLVDNIHVFFDVLKELMKEHGSTYPLLKMYAESMSDINYLFEKGSLAERDLWSDIPDDFAKYEKKWANFLKKYSHSNGSLKTSESKLFSEKKYSHSHTDIFNSEQPAKTDKLNRLGLVRALVGNLVHGKNFDCRVIALFGEWGSGKSSVVEFLEASLKTQAEQPFIFGKFNAWAYEHTDNIQAGVAQEMINALTSAPESVEGKAKRKPESENKKTALGFGLIGNKLLSLIHKLPDLLTNCLLMDIRDMRAGAVNFVTRRKLWVTMAWLVQRAFLTLQFSVKTHPFEILKILTLLLIAAMPWFSDWFQQLIEFTESLADKSRWIWAGGVSLYTLREFGKLIISPQAKELLTYLRLPSYAEHLGKIPVMRKHISTLCELRLKGKNGKTPRLLFVVDDLDRCSPEAIVKVLEAVRLVLDLENVIVLIAIDQHIALAALSKHFKDFALHHKLKNSHAIAREYLSKVINLPIVLTAPSGDDVQIFMADLWKDMPKASPEGAGSASQKAPVDKAPEPGTGEATPPLVDSTSQPDNVPVTDSSPNPGLTDDVKPKAPESDQPPSGEINPIKALSSEQQASFIHWVNYFELTNPRQLKRLNNSYDLMRSYFVAWDKAPVAFNFPNENAQPVYPMLLTLILMEHLNSFEDLDARGRLWKKLLPQKSEGSISISENITRVDPGTFDKKSVSPAFINAYRELYKLEGYEDMAVKVEAFVLPAMV